MVCPDAKRPDRRGGFGAGQCRLRLDPPFELFVQTLMVSLSNRRASKESRGFF
jgi:hypothetical protein